MASREGKEGEKGLGQVPADVPQLEPAKNQPAPPSKLLQWCEGSVKRSKNRWKRMNSSEFNGFQLISSLFRGGMQVYSGLKPM